MWGCCKLIFCTRRSKLYCTILLTIEKIQIAFPFIYLLNLVDLTFEKNCFRLGSEFPPQIMGVVKGSPCGPDIVNIFMDYLEKNIIMLVTIILSVIKLFVIGSLFYWIFANENKIKNFLDGSINCILLLHMRSNITEHRLLS